MKEQQPWLLRQGSMQLMMLGAKHSDSRALLLQWKHLAIGEESTRRFFLLGLFVGPASGLIEVYCCQRHLYGHLSISLVRLVARSIMGREIVN